MPTGFVPAQRKAGADQHFFGRARSRRLRRGRISPTAQRAKATDMAASDQPAEDDVGVFRAPVAKTAVGRPCCRVGELESRRSWSPACRPVAEDRGRAPCAGGDDRGAWPGPCTPGRAPAATTAVVAAAVTPAAVAGGRIQRPAHEGVSRPGAEGWRPGWAIPFGRCEVRPTSPRSATACNPNSRGPARCPRAALRARSLPRSARWRSRSATRGPSSPRPRAPEST